MLGIVLGAGIQELNENSFLPSRGTLGGRGRHTKTYCIKSSQPGRVLW